MIKTILPQSHSDPSCISSAGPRYSRSLSSPQSTSPSQRSSRSLSSDQSRSPSPVSRFRSHSVGARSPSPVSSSPGEPPRSYSPLPNLSGYSGCPKPSPIRLNTVPSIYVRPARVSSSVNPRVLNRLRRKVAAQLDDSVPCHSYTTSPKSDLSRTSKSADASPNLRCLKRSTSLKGFKTKFCRTGSDGLSGYEPIQPNSDDILIPRERIVSVNRAIRGKPATRSYRPMSLIPAANRIIHYDSSDESDGGESSLDLENLSRCREDISPGPDENGAKKAAGARGKSGGTMMMKLAKKFSKKNLPITRDDDYLEGEWRLSQRSNSVSKLDALDGMRHRSLSMEHLVPTDVDAGGRVAASVTPQLSPTMPRSWSKNKLGYKKSVDPDADSIMSGGLYRAGSKKNLCGDPSEALFEAIELGKVDTVASLLDSGLVTKFNITNEDDLLPVDLSVMLGQHSITRLLLSKGAKDSSKFCRDPMFRQQRIRALIGEADREIFKLQEEITSLGATNSSGLKDADKRYKKAEFRAHLCRVMFRNYEKADVPDPPTNVQLHVTSSRSLMVTFSEPENVNNAMVTRYKIEWCLNSDFKPAIGEFMMTDLRNMEYVIPDLDKGDTYYVRVSAYNMKGFGRSQISVPSSASPSCWHDLDQTQPRYLGCTNSIHNVAALFEQSIQEATLTSPQSQPGPLGTLAAAPAGRNRSVRRTNPISRMFSSAVKFHKSLKAGVYIASLFYSDESRLLVTTDDHIPIVDVADATGTAIGQDFVWLANLACTWENVQAMTDITDACTTSPAIQFRNMLLHAVLDLQNALEVMDLGLLHPVPYKDSQGAIVFVIVQYTKDTKAVASGNSSLKWTDLPKLWKRRGTPSRSVGLEAFPVPEQVVLDTQEIIAHHRTATNPMNKGLYLGYLKGRSSVASMKVICPREHPNVLPHLKIRNNPNLSSDEWQWLKSLQSPSCPLPLHSSCPQSLQQLLLPSLHLFLKNLGFKHEEASHHQLYVQEVIELNEDITILLVLPPPDKVCTAPGSSDHFVDQPDFVALPISTFEIMQLYAYQRSFMTKFSMVRARVDVELLASVHLLREALSKAEVKEAREKKEKLEDFHSRTDLVWRQMRWIEEAIQTGRDYQASSDRLLSVATVSRNIEKQRVEAEEQRRKKEEALLHSKAAVGAQGGQEAAAKPSGGHLRVMLSYRTGLVRGSIVKLFVEQKTTTAEVIKLVVTQVALTSRTTVETDLSDYFLVASIGGKKEKILEPDYAPLRLQMNAAESKDKVLLMVRKHSEEAQLNQMVTNV